MNNLLSSADNRRFNILSYLLNAHEQSITLSEIENNLHIPRKTIYRDIEVLNDQIAPLTLRNSSRDGIKLHIPAGYSSAHIYKKTLEYSREYTLLEYLFQNPRSTTESILHALNLSLSTYRRTVQHINQKLTESKEGFKISFRTNYFTGNATYLRQYMSFYFSERYSVTSEFLSLDQQTLIETLIKHILPYLNKQNTYNNFRKTSIWVYCNLCSYSLEKSKNKTLVIPATDYPILSDTNFISLFEKTFAVPLNSNTISYLFKVYTNKDYSHSFDELQWNIKSNPKVALDYQKTQLLINQLKTYFNADITPENEQQLITTLVNMFRIPTGGRLYILNNRRLSFIQSLNMRYPNAIHYIFSAMEYCYSKKISDDGLIEFAHHILTGWSGIINSFKNVERKLEIGLLLDCDEMQAQFIKNEIRQQCYFPHVLTVVSSEEAINYHHLDVLITNISDYFENQQNVICIAENMNNADWERLDSIYRSICKS